MGEKYKPLKIFPGSFCPKGDGFGFLAFFREISQVSMAFTPFTTLRSSASETPGHLAAELGVPRTLRTFCEGTSKMLKPKKDGPGNMSFPIQIGMIFLQVDEWCFVWGVYLFFCIFCLGYFFRTQEGIYLI